MSAQSINIATGKSQESLKIKFSQVIRVNFRKSYLTNLVAQNFLLETRE